MGRLARVIRSSVISHQPAPEPCVLVPETPTAACVSLEDRFFTLETRQIWLLICFFGFSQLYAAQSTQVLSHACSMTMTMHARLAAQSQPSAWWANGLAVAVGSSSMHEPPLDGTPLHTITRDLDKQISLSVVFRIQLCLDDEADHLVLLDISSRFVSPSWRYQIANINLDL
jgi:hypothetical protein